MGRTRAGIAAVWVASALLACHARKPPVIDAGGEPEQEAESAVEAAATSASAAPSASAEPAPKRAVHCETGEVAIVLPQGDETCVVECKTTSDCPPTWTCDGEGPISHNGRPGNGVHFCRSAAHGKVADGGSAGPDAGHAAHAPDAGAPAKKPEHHDGGAKGR